MKKILITILSLFMLSCYTAVDFDDIYSPECGNGIVDTNEHCDSETILCSDYDAKYKDGVVQCSPDCNGYIIDDCVLKDDINACDSIQIVSNTTSHSQFREYGMISFNIKNIGVNNCLNEDIIEEDEIYINLFNNFNIDNLVSGKHIIGNSWTSESLAYGYIIDRLTCNDQEFDYNNFFFTDSGYILIEKFVKNSYQEQIKITMINIVFKKAIYNGWGKDAEIIKHNICYKLPNTSFSVILDI